MYIKINDLQSVTDYHGMFAHVHSTGKHFSHAGQWITLASENYSDTQADTEISNS